MHLRDVDAVLAEIASVAFSFKMGEETRKVNVEGARNLLEIVLSSGVQKVIYSSSATIHGDVRAL